MSTEPYTRAAIPTRARCALRRPGFTIIEILVVILVLAVLASLVAPNDLPGRARPGPGAGPRGHVPVELRVIPRPCGAVVRDTIITCGFMAVRLPSENFDAEGRGAFSSKPPSLGDIYYGGLDRMPWFDVEEALDRGVFPVRVDADL